MITRLVRQAIAELESRRDKAEHKISGLWCLQVEDADMQMGRGPFTETVDNN